MLLQGKPLSQIDLATLQGLIANGVAEDKTLEYKRVLPSSGDHDKAEFLADVSALANSSGGFILFGVAEQKGRAVALPGLGGIDEDAEKLRLESMMLAGIQPRIPIYRFSSIELSPGNSVLVLEVEQSWLSPHMVAVQHSCRFFARNSAGKYLMDVQQIRTAFLASATISDQLRDLRLARLARIGAAETPVALAEGPKAVVHTVPIAAYRDPTAIDTQAVMGVADKQGPLFLGASYRHPSFDGVLAYQVEGPREGPWRITSYIQVFRNGLVEAARLIEPDGDSEQGARLLPYVSEERHTVDICRHALAFYQQLGIQPPIAIYISLVGVRGMTVSTQHLPVMADVQPIDRDTLPLPDILLNEYPSTAGRVVDELRPAFDALWNAMGLPEWPSYAERRKEFGG